MKSGNINRKENCMKSELQNVIQYFDLRNNNPAMPISIKWSLVAAALALVGAAVCARM